MDNEFTRVVAGDYAIYNNSLLFRAGVFNDRKVKGKPLVITEKHVESMVDKFTGPIGGNIQHSDFLRGRAGHILDVKKVGKELRGTVAIPLAFDELLTDDEKKVSVELNPVTFDEVDAFALCLKPAVTDAHLMSAEQAYFAKKPAHTTIHGQDTIQSIHNMSARAGAICSDADDDGKMVSKSESKGIQAIHDMAVANGASCSQTMAYYTEQEDTPGGNEIVTFDDVKALLGFMKETYVEPAIAKPNANTTRVLDPSGVEHRVENGDTEVVDVTKTAEFMAKEAENATLAAKIVELEKIKSQVEADAKAKLDVDNAKAIDALVIAGKLDPKDRASFTEKRAVSPELFDSMAELMPVKEEYKNTSTTITGEEARDNMDPKNADRKKIMQADREKLARLGGGF